MYPACLSAPWSSRSHDHKHPSVQSSISTPAVRSSKQIINMVTAAYNSLEFPCLSSKCIPAELSSFWMANADHRHCVSHIHPWSPFLMSMESISSDLNSSLHRMNYLAPDITSQAHWAPDILAFSSFLAPISLLPTNSSGPCAMYVYLCVCAWVIWIWALSTQQFPSSACQSHIPHFTKVGILFVDTKTVPWLLLGGNLLPPLGTVDLRHSMLVSIKHLPSISSCIGSCIKYVQDGIVVSLPS